MRKMAVALAVALVGGTTITWQADLTFSGLHTGTRTTSPGGFVVTSRGLGAGGIFTGTLTTTLDGLTFRSPTS